MPPAPVTPACAVRVFNCPEAQGLNPDGSSLESTVSDSNGFLVCCLVKWECRNYPGVVVNIRGNCACTVNAEAIGRERRWAGSGPQLRPPSEVTSSVGQLNCADPQRHPEKARKLLVTVSATQLEVSELGFELEPI